MGIMEDLGSSSVKIWRIDKVALDMFWPEVEQLLEKYPGGITIYAAPADIKQAVFNGSLDLFVAVEEDKVLLAGLTCFQGSTNKYLEILWIGGRNFKKIQRLALERMELWAALHGARSIVGGGRRGWTKVLEEIGFKFHRVEMIKPVRFILTDTGISRRQ